MKKAQAYISFAVKLQTLGREEGRNICSRCILVTHWEYLPKRSILAEGIDDQWSLFCFPFSRYFSRAETTASVLKIRQRFWGHLCDLETLWDDACVSASFLAGESQTLRITKAFNHREVQVGKDSWRPPGPNFW